MMLTRRRCCCKTTPNVTVGTYWCATTTCVAPGTITVTITLQGPLDPITGDPTCPLTAVVATETADADGNAKFTLPSGNYCASASTTASGYLNVPFPFTVSGSSPFTVFSALFPEELHISDATTGGSAVVYPYGPVPAVLGTGDATAGLYATTTPYTYSYPGDGDCPARDVYIYYFFSCGDLSSGGLPYVGAAMRDTVSSGDLGICCPGGPGSPGYCVASGGAACIVVGDGPGAGPPPTCYPVSETGPATVPTSTIGGAGKIYTATSAFTLTQ
jgi:hypothetical protein